MIITDFIALDYDYFDLKGKNYIRIIGRNSKGKRVCIIDSCDVYFWAILREGVKEKKIESIIKRIEKIKLNVKGRETKVESVKIENKKFLEKPVKALKIFCTNYKDLHDVADELDFPEIEFRRGYDLGFITHYIIEKNLKPLCWYEIKGEIANEKFQGIENLDIDVCIELKSIKELEEERFNPKVLSYDIETDDIKIGEGEILMVSLVSDNFKKVITWKKPKKNSKKIDYVEYVNDEEELLRKFLQYVKEISPDFLVGYFSDGFDLPYLRARADKLKIPLEIGLDGSQPRFSRGRNVGIFTSKIFGIVHIDLLKFIQTAYSQYMQSETMSLNEVSKEFLGEEKKNFKIKHSSIIEDHDWENYYAYNLQDSILTFKLFEKMWPDLLEFTKIMQEPVFDISRNGMSANVEDYIIHNLKKFNEIPEKRPIYEEISKRKHRERYEGAFVFEPTPGLYEDIAFFDFTSFWPSIIVTYNLSRSTLLEKKAENTLEIEVLGKKVYFSKKPGFFPQMLKEIIEKRKKYKKELTKEPDAIKRARSNAYKLLANASYGYQGFFGARYYCPEASGAATAIGREWSKKTIKKINNQGFNVIYSDSVSGNSKVIIKKHGDIYEECIEDLFEKTDSKNIIDKEYNYKKNIKVLTLDKNGNVVFKPIEYIVRHKCKKKMYRINFTNNWYIDVTEDHSLIGYESTKFDQTKLKNKNPLKRLIEIKPEEIKKKANSIITLKKIPYKNVVVGGYPKEVYEFMGYFVGDGSFMKNRSHQKRNKDYYLRVSLGSDGPEIFKKLITPLIKKGYIKNYWWSKSRKGDLTINGMKLINLIAKEFRKDNKKKIPSWFFRESEENIASFLRGLFSADGTVMLRNNAPIIKFTSINEDHIKEVRKLLYRVGIAHSVFKENSVNKYKDKKKKRIFSSGSFSKNIILKNNEIFYEKIGFLINRKNERAKIKTKSLKKKLIKDFEFDLQQVKNIERIKNPGYVYDLEVKDTHTFFANYVLAHNTDSIAFHRGDKTKDQVLEFLNELNSKLPGIMELELEGFFKRGIWVTKRTGKVGAKKKYALIDEQNRLKIRGFETVRRDWCNLARKVQNKVIKHILEEGNEKKALEYVKEIIKKIKKREIERRDLIIKTQLKKTLSEYKAISPHVIAARRMKEKNIPIIQGNIIEYFISESSEKRKLVRERVKLPQEKGDYDIEYYLKNQLIPAVENIFQVFNINIDETIEGRKQTKICDF